MIANIEQLNRDIEQFPQVTPITPDMKLTFKGVSRTVMLDRYAFKDAKKDTLKIGDLVVLTYKDDPKFPRRGYGIVQAWDKTRNKLTVELDPQFEGGATVEVDFGKVDKPLELYYEQVAARNARGLSEVETTEEKRDYWQQRFEKVLAKKRTVPAGRVINGAGSGQGVTFFNCYVMPFIHDSRGGIGEHRKKVMEIMSRGGGVGTNGSTLRPRNAFCYGVNGRSSGAVTWLNDLSNLTNLVEQGGSRRGAQMIMLNDWHPDIVEFIISKMQNPRILRFIMKTTKSDLIREEAQAKLKFVPLTQTQRLAYESLVEKYAGSQEHLDQVNEAQDALDEGGTYDVHNPEFLTGANISVCLTKDFMAALENDDYYELRFPDTQNHDDGMRKIYDAEWQDCGDVREWEAKGYPVKVYHRIKAQDLWDLINICATYSAEPGIFFIDNANDMTNARAYGQKVVATNPCGEQPLAPYSVCNLAAINLAEHTHNGQVAWELLKETTKTQVRLQDNVIDATPYFMEENTKQALGERRLGMGVMGLADLLIRIGVRYGSPESLEIVEEIFKNIAIWAYEESIEIAKEKGEFPFLSNEDGTPNMGKRAAFINSGYMRKMPEHIREGILKYGIRNSHLLTVAPTGSTGTMINVSTGLEPYFGFVYYRSGRLGKFIPVVADIAKEWLENAGYEVSDENVYEMLEKLPNYFVSAMELTPEAHADMQCVIQKWVDSSLSKTVNAPRGYTVRQVAKVYERLHKGGAKGGTVYVDGSRDAQVLSLTAEDNDLSRVELDVDDADVEVAVASETSDTNKIGTEIGDTCPVCEAGTVVDAGGCHTCNNCQSQLVCGL